MSDDLLRAHVRRLLDWEDAHIGFEVAVKDFPRELRGKQVEGLPYLALATCRAHADRATRHPRFLSQSELRGDEVARRLLAQDRGAPER